MTKQMLEKKACWNEPIIHDTFVLPFDVKNLTKKKVNELWQKHLKNPINIKMWVTKNPKLVCYYVKHVFMDLNCTSHDDTTFFLGIQTPWW